jgi:hypothetical protein
VTVRLPDGLGQRAQGGRLQTTAARGLVSVALHREDLTQPAVAAADHQRTQACDVRQSAALQMATARYAYEQVAADSPLPRLVGASASERADLPDDDASVSADARDDVDDARVGE